MKAKVSCVALLLAMTLVGCGESSNYDPEHKKACYTKDGVFKKYDDDCHDDGLVTYAEIMKRTATPNPRPSSAGLKTATQPKPAAPVVKRTRKS